MSWIGLFIKYKSISRKKTVSEIDLFEFKLFYFHLMLLIFKCSCTIAYWVKYFSYFILLSICSVDVILVWSAFAIVDPKAFTECLVNSLFQYSQIWFLIVKIFMGIKMLMKCSSRAIAWIRATVVLCIIFFFKGKLGLPS